jgi:hypothetical protein
MSLIFNRKGRENVSIVPSSRHLHTGVTFLSCFLLRWLIPYTIPHFAYDWIDASQFFNFPNDDKRTKPPLERHRTIHKNIIYNENRLVHLLCFHCWSVIETSATFLGFSAKQGKGKAASIPSRTYLSRANVVSRGCLEKRKSPRLAFYDWYTKKRRKWWIRYWQDCCNVEVTRMTTSCACLCVYKRKWKHAMHACTVYYARKRNSSRYSSTNETIAFLLIIN